jgi:hypothetical protein
MVGWRYEKQWKYTSALMLPDCRMGIKILEGPPRFARLSFCQELTCKKNTSMEHRWNGTDRGKTEAAKPQYTATFT